MTGLIVRRLMQLPLIIGVIYTIAFTLAWLVPGNPLENPEGRRPPEEIMQAMQDVKTDRTVPVPRPLRDGHYQGAERLGNEEEALS